MTRQNGEAAAIWTHLRPLSPKSEDLSANPFEITLTLDLEP
jgi:hypothetical protein